MLIARIEKVVEFTRLDAEILEKESLKPIYEPANLAIENAR